MDKRTRAILRGRIADSLSRIAERKRVKDGLWSNVKAKANDIRNDVVNVGRTVKNYSYMNSENAVNQIIKYVEGHPNAKIRVQGVAKVGQSMEPVTLLVNKGKYMILTTETKKKLSKGSADELLFGLEEVGFQGQKKQKKTEDEPKQETKKDEPKEEQKTEKKDPKTEDKGDEKEDKPEEKS